MHVLKYLVPLLITISAYGQRHGVVFGVGSEMTVTGPFGAAYGGVELNRHFFGGFYASKINYNANEYSPPHRLAGGFYQFTFYRETNLQVGAMLRAGFVDSEFFVYLPSLVVDYVMSDYFKLSLTAGARGQNPAIGLNAFFNIPLKKNEFPNPVKISFKKKDK